MVSMKEGPKDKEGVGGSSRYMSSEDQNKKKPRDSEGHPDFGSRGYPST